MTTSPPTPDRARGERRRLALATAGALAVALVVLVVAVLPAEYGVDPTGIGRATGLTRLAPAASGSPARGEIPDAVTPPSDTATLQTYASTYPLAYATLLDHEGYLASGETALVPVAVATPNLTRVIARLNWADANETAGQSTRPDLFEVEVQAANGDVGTTVLGRNAPGSGGQIEADLVWRAAPFPRELEAASRDEATRAFRANDPRDASGAGEWKIRVTLLEAGGAEPSGLALPGTVESATDAGNAWKLTVIAESFDLAVAAKPGTTVRQDRTTFTLAPGEELEYKLVMALGKKVEYAWQTGGPAVYVDFHGEKTGDASGAFTRHKNGDFAADAGTLVAPFDGRHGWFWRNSSGETVTIALETKGTYDVLGIV